MEEAAMYVDAVVSSRDPRAEKACARSRRARTEEDSSGIESKQGAASEPRNNHQGGVAAHCASLYLSARWLE